LLQKKEKIDKINKKIEEEKTFQDVEQFDKVPYKLRMAI